MLSAARQVEEGTPRADVARLYGVSLGTVDNWIGKVREARQDARRAGG